MPAGAHGSERRGAHGEHGNCDNERRESWEFHFPFLSNLVSRWTLGRITRTTESDLYIITSFVDCVLYYFCGDYRKSVVKNVLRFFKKVGSKRRKAPSTNPSGAGPATTDKNHRRPS